MKIVSAHQPHFLPWMGYFNKVINSDVFIWLEDVQFRKNYFQNRTKIKANDNEQWLSIPVKKASLKTNINEIEIVSQKDVNKISKTLQTCYSKTDYFNEYFPLFESVFSRKYQFLNDINYDLFKLVMDLLKIETKIVRSVELLKKEYVDPNDRLLAMCNALEATHYIAGKGSRNYMDEALYLKNDINILWQEFPSNAISYNQINKEFIAGLSILDVLFNVGGQKTRELILTPWQTN